MNCANRHGVGGMEHPGTGRGGLTRPGFARSRARGDRWPTRGILVPAFLAGALFSGALPVSPATAAVPIRYERLGHPRLFVKPSDVPVIRGWLQSPGSDNKRLFNLWRTYMNSRLMTPDPVGTGYKTDTRLADIAAMYLLTGVPAYGDSAVRISMWTARSGKQQWSSNSGPGGCSNLALAYDWCYERFSAAQRDTVEGCLARAASRNQSAGGQWYWYHTYRFEYSFAIVDEAESYTYSPDGSVYTNADVRRWIEKYLSDLQDGYLPCLSQVAPAGYQESYSGRRQVPMLVFIASLLGVVDWDPMSEPSIANIGSAYLARYRPDGEFIRTPNKYNYAEATPTFIFSFYGSRGHDQRCQDLVNRIDDSYRTNGNFALLWTYLFYHDPAAPARDLLSLEPSDLVFYDKGQGAFLGRTGWHLGSTSRDIMVGFWCGGMFGPYDSEWNRHLGHFVVSRGEDCLLIDSGSYLNDSDNHHMPYGKSTLAHNTISIFRPDMVRGSYNDCHEHPGGLQLPNDGGQELASRNFVRCPDCNRGGGGGTPPFYSGWITNEVADQVGAAEIRLEADLSPAYQSRASRVLRRWMWVRPDWIVIQDRIDAQPGNGDTIRIVFHCVERPQVNGTFVTERGNILFGGVFRSSNTTRAVVNNGESSARIFFREGSGAGLPVVRMIGGTNAGGSFNAGWQQDYDPQFDEPEPSTHFDTYTPGGTSYEFWIDGKNYPPADTDCKTGDSDYLKRNSPDVGHKASPSGDWRLEYQVVAASSPVVLTTLVHVTQRDAPEEAVTYQPIPEDPGKVLIRLPGDDGQVREMTLGPPGEVVSSGQWEGGP